MDKQVYRRGRIGTAWYNAQEALAYLLLFRPTPNDLEYQRRIAYGAESKEYYLTYQRKDMTSKRKPLFIYIHGGGFISGITQMRNGYIRNFAQKGYFVASISYTYAPQKVFPAQLQELCTAIDQILDRENEYNIDPSKLVLSGESAGGYFVMMLANIATNPELADNLGLKFRHLNDFAVKAMVVHSGCFDLKKLFDPAYPQSQYNDIGMMTCSYLGMNYDEAMEFLRSPQGEVASAHINEHFAPTFFATGAADLLRFESYDFIEQYKQLGIPYEHFEGTGSIAAHAWTIATVLKKARECLKATFDFLDKYVSMDECERGE